MKVYLAGGRSVVVHRVSRPLRRGDKVVVRHTYYGVHGATSGEWYSVETLSRGGKNPRDSYGTPIDLERIVGVVFDEKETVS